MVLSLQDKEIFELSSKQDALVDIEKFLGEFDITLYNKKDEQLQDLREGLDQILDEIENLEREQKDIQSKTCLLKEVPCGPEFSHCKFIKDAYKAMDKKEDIHKQVEDFLSKKENTEQEIEEIDPEQIQSIIEKYNQLETKKASTENDIVKVELSLEKRKQEISSL